MLLNTAPILTPEKLTICPFPFRETLYFLHLFPISKPDPHSSKRNIPDFPGDPVVKIPPVNAGDTDSVFGLGKWTQILSLVWGNSTAEEQQSPSAPTIEPTALKLLKPAHLEPVLGNKGSRRNEKAPHHNWQVAPYLQPLEKARVQQGRPSTAIKNIPPIYASMTKAFQHPCI